jgi:hypothetical protein
MCVFLSRMLSIAHTVQQQPSEIRMICYVLIFDETRHFLSLILIVASTSLIEHTLIVHFALILHRF